MGGTCSSAGEDTFLTPFCGGQAGHIPTSFTEIHEKRLYSSCFVLRKQEKYSLRESGYTIVPAGVTTESV